MENITKVAYETICKLILESEWGKSVNNKELFCFLFNEIYEFLEGCNKDDKDNMLEEASDVLMILLYIVIKNTGDQQGNQIEELLQRLNHKLRTRYSVFFEGEQDSEKEEQHWIQAKHIEKEFLQFLFCPEPNCADYARVNKGNMLIDSGIVKCQSCGYTAKCSSHNTLFYTSNSRRKLFDRLDNSYIGYLKGTYFYADDYFNSHRRDYVKVIRYWICNKSGGFALENYFVYRHATPRETFDEFLMQPLRNHLKIIYNCEAKQLNFSIEINDLMIRCINVNYIKIKSKFCRGENPQYYDIWINYIRYLLKSMILPVSYETITLCDQILSLNMNCSHLLNSYILHVITGEDKKIDIYFMQFSTGDKKNEVILQTDISSCESNIQIGQVLLSAILKFNLQHMPKLQCILLKEANGLNRQAFSTFLKDLLPMLELSNV